MVHNSDNPVQMEADLFKVGFMVASQSQSLCTFDLGS